MSSSSQPVNAAQVRKLVRWALYSQPAKPLPLSPEQAKEAEKLAKTFRSNFPEVYRHFDKARGTVCALLFGLASLSGCDPQSANSSSSPQATQKPPPDLWWSERCADRRGCPANYRCKMQHTAYYDSLGRCIRLPGRIRQPIDAPIRAELNCSKGDK